MPIVGDCREVHRRPDRRASQAEHDAGRTRRLRGLVGAARPAGARPTRSATTSPTDGSLAPQYVIERLGEIAGPEAIYAAGVGQHQMWAAQFIKYEKPEHLAQLRRRSGRWATPCRRRWAPRSASPDATVWAIDGDGCFQMTNQELATCAINDIPIKVAIINNGSLGMVRQWQTLFYDERYSQHRPAHRRTRRIPDFVKLAEALRLRRAALRDAEDVDATIEKAMAINDRPVVVDFVVHQDAMVWPMVAAGTSNDDIQFARDIAPDVGPRRTEPMTQSHAVRPGREQARCPGPRRRAVLPARLQHRVARGRPDRARRTLAHHDRRRRRGAAARAGDQAAQQARQRHQDRRARPGAVGAARAAARQGAGRPRDPLARARDRPAVPRQGRRRRPGRRHDRGHRQRRQARGAAAGARAVRHQGARAVRAWSPSAAAPRSITDRVAARASTARA